MAHDWGGKSKISKRSIIPARVSLGEKRGTIRHDTNGLRHETTWFFGISEGERGTHIGISRKGFTLRYFIRLHRH